MMKNVSSTEMEIWLVLFEQVDLKHLFVCVFEYFCIFLEFLITEAYSFRALRLSLRATVPLFGSSDVSVYITQCLEKH